MNKTKTIHLLESETTFWYNNKILHIVLLIFVSSIILFPNINSNPIYSWDEARHAINALEMLRSGDWITLTYNKVPDMANLKFPLGAWLIVIDYKLLGVNEFSLRLWSVLFTILTTILVYLLGSLIKNRWAGILAGLIFISSMLVVNKHAGITGDYDAGASFFLTLSLLLFLLFYEKGNRRFLYLSMISIGLGVMYKSFVPGLLPLFIIFIFLLFSKDKKLLFNPKILLYCVLIIIAIISPWLIARSSVDSSFLSKLINVDYWNRLTSAVDDHGEPFWFYITQLKDGFYPWLYFLPFGLVLLFRNYKKNRNENDIFLIVWFFTIFLIFSIAETKNYWYMLPAFPVMAIIISSFLLTLLEIVSKLRFGKFLSTVLLTFIILNIALALFNVRYYLLRNVQQNREHLSFFINQETVKEELESLDILIVGDNLGTQSNNFYLKRLLDDRFVFSSTLYCALTDKQRMLLKAETDFVRYILEKCPEREVSKRYGGYVLIK